MGENGHIIEDNGGSDKIRLKNRRTRLVHSCERALTPYACYAGKTRPLHGCTFRYAHVNEAIIQNLLEQGIDSARSFYLIKKPDIKRLIY